MASLTKTGVWICALAALCLPGSGQAASESGGFAVRGIGAQTCAELTERLEKDENGTVLQFLGAWAGGYLTHANRAMPGTYDAVPIIDNVVVALLAGRICRTNPDSFVESVFADLVGSFGAGALAAESELIEIRTDEHATTLRREVFRKVQELLIEEGHLSAGSADGYFGPRSRQALVDYQNAEGIAATGIPDPGTLIAMFVRSGTN